MSDHEEAGAVPGKSPAFVTTHWTAVLEAAAGGVGAAGEAMAELYQDYWYPLYAHVRRRGYGIEDAEDITQNFFAALMEKQRLAGVTREGGRFRSFLLGGLERFLANEWDRRTAQKRGGGVVLLALEESGAEERFAQEGEQGLPPDVWFDRRWAMTLIHRALNRLRVDLANRNREAWWEWLPPLLHGEGQGRSYAEIAASIGQTEGAFKVTVHRLRARYGELLREEVARTVDSADEVETELRYLIEVFAR